MISTSQIQAKFDLIAMKWGQNNNIALIWRNSANNDMNEQAVSTVVAFPQHLSLIHI